MNKAEIRNCQNCKNEFIIEPDDFTFYEKIKVPPPTWCPECRLRRRLIFRNERTLYRRMCNFGGKEIFSIFSPDKPHNVYDRDIWWSDSYDPLQHGRIYNFSRPFFEQFQALLESAPLPNLMFSDSINTKYANQAAHLKNSYMIFNADEVEDSFYNNTIFYCKQCADNFDVFKCELCYQCVNARESNSCRFSQDLYSSYGLSFCYECRNCNNCILSTNLRGKNHYIRNKAVSKEEYLQHEKEFISGSHSSIVSAEQEFSKFKHGAIRRANTVLHSSNCTGDFIKNSKNSHRCFYISGCEDCKYAYFVDNNVKDGFDITYAIDSELVYETNSSAFTNKQLFDHVCYYGHSIYYSFSCMSCENIFGCVGLRKKQYCILNKQYTKEEYEELVPKIIEHMNTMPYVDAKGRVYKYGEFFPSELSPFAYNETIAQEYFPLTKEQALEQGYSWKDPEERNYQITMSNDQLPDHIKDADDSILKQIIGCAHVPAKALARAGEGKAAIAEGLGRPQCNEQCTTAFKIIEPELQFYRKMNLPLPRLCPNCRHYQRLKQRNPLRLWHRKCACAGSESENDIYKNTISHFHGPEHCPNEFETSYSPERPEIVYCEQCYQQEVV